jgi:hypothetical protein
MDTILSNQDPCPTSLVHLTLALAAAVLTSTGGCAIWNMDGGPPSMSERYHDLQELYPAMEALVAEAVAPLEAFPGFASRLVTTDPCYGGEHGLEAFPDTANLNLSYEFAEEYWDDQAIRVDLLEAVKANWVELGYEVEDEESRTGKHRTVTATPDGELYIRYRSLGVVLIDVYHTRCVEPSVLPELEPAGGVPPENDRTHLG